MTRDVLLKKWPAMGLLFCMLSLTLLTPLAAAASEPAPTVVWMDIFGGAEWDEATGAAADATGVYVSGWSWTGLPGETALGQGDAFIRKYDTTGNIVWTTQFGTPRPDKAFDIVLYAEYLYVAGITEGVFPGQSETGSQDAFVAKFDLSGNPVWIVQFGAGESTDAFGIDADASGIYVVGSTYGTFPGETFTGMVDAYVRKLDHAGNEIWTRQFGTTGMDQAWGVAAGPEGVYVTGRVSGTLPGQTSAGDTDAFLKKFDLSGNELWIRQFGSLLWDVGWDVAMDAGGVYVAGSAGGPLPGQTSAGLTDAFLRKYSHAGTEVWTRQFGTAGDGAAFAMAILDGVYVAGSVAGALPGQTHGGEADAFVRKYDTAGNEVWTVQFGGSPIEVARGLAVVPGSVYVAGAVFLGWPDVQAFAARLEVEVAPPPPPVVPAMPAAHISGALVGAGLLLGLVFLSRRRARTA